MLSGDGARGVGSGTETASAGADIDSLGGGGLTTPIRSGGPFPVDTELPVDPEDSDEQEVTQNETVEVAAWPNVSVATTVSVCEPSESDRVVEAYE